MEINMNATEELIETLNQYGKYFLEKHDHAGLAMFRAATTIKGQYDNIGHMLDALAKLGNQRNELLEALEMVYAMKPRITECRLHGTIWEDIGKAIANAKGTNETI